MPTNDNHRFLLPTESAPSLPLGANLSDLAELIHWINGLGIKTNSTRLERYRRYLKASLDDEPFDPEKIFKNLYDGPIQHELDLQLYILREVHELNWIWNGIKNNMPNGIELKLRKIVGGRDFAALDQDSSSRNLQFELRIASYFCRHKLKVDVSTDTDIIAQSKKEKFFVECKRIASEKQVQAKLNEAAKQLHSRMPKRGRNYGVIALDLTKVAFSHNGITLGTSSDHLKSNIQSKLASIEASWEHSNTARSDPRVLLIWKQIHIAGFTQYPAQNMTRFSNLFDVKYPLFWRQNCSFKRLKKVIESRDKDPRTIPSHSLKLKRHVSLEAGTQFAWDMELIHHYCKHLKLPERDGESNVLDMSSDGTDWTKFTYYELVFAEANLSHTERISLKGNTNLAMGCLMAMLIFWREPYSR